MWKAFGDSGGRFQEIPGAGFRDSGGWLLRFWGVELDGRLLPGPRRKQRAQQGLLELEGRAAEDLLRI